MNIIRPPEDDSIDAICDALGLCGCGLPEKAMAYLAAVLRHIDRLKQEVWEDNLTLTHAQWQEAGKALFVNEGAECFTYYFLDKLNLIEHGGSVPGWLSEEGRAMLERIDALPATARDGREEGL